MITVARLYLLQNDVSQPLDFVGKLGLHVDPQNVFCPAWSNENTTFLYVLWIDFNNFLKALGFCNGYLIPAANELVFVRHGGLEQAARVVFVQIVKHLGTKVAVFHDSFDHQKVGDAVVARCVSHFEQGAKLLSIHVLFFVLEDFVKPLPIDVKRAVSIRFIMSTDHILANGLETALDPGGHLDLGDLILLKILLRLIVLISCVNHADRHTWSDSQHLKFLINVGHEEGVEFVHSDQIESLAV